MQGRPPIQRTPDSPIYTTQQIRDEIEFLRAALIPNSLSLSPSPSSSLSPSSTTTTTTSSISPSPSPLSLSPTLSSFASRVLFCHNDLQEGNLIYDTKCDLLHAIDFEYGSYNFIGFDLADHMTETYIDNHRNIVDRSLSPSLSFITTFCREYLKKYSELTQVSTSDNGTSCSKITEEEVKSLVKVVRWFMLSVHLQWVIWAVIQDNATKIDFGYMDYACQRLEEYYRMKEELLKEEAERK